MKTIIFLLFITLIATSHANTYHEQVEITGNVISTIFGSQSEQLSEDYCALIIESNGRKLAIIEDIYDCFWTRLGNERSQQPISIPTRYLQNWQEYSYKFNRLPNVDQYFFAEEE